MSLKRSKTYILKNIFIHGLIIKNNNKDLKIKRLSIKLKTRCLKLNILQIKLLKFMSIYKERKTSLVYNLNNSTVPNFA